jgi:phosphomannomutase
MAQELIITVSGLRGVIGQNLTASIAADYGCAFGSFLNAARTDPKQKLSVCIGQDSRPSGLMLEAAVTAGLTAAGIDVIDLGIVTTPGVGIMVKHLNCAGGIVITASHNPPEYNGIKLILANGMAPPPDAAEKIKSVFLDRDFTLADALNCGTVATNVHTDAIHIAKVLQVIDKDSIDAKKFKVVLDSVNGSGARAAKKLLTALGCKIEAINDEPTGIFAHKPEPLAENLTAICDVVKREKAHIGFAQDPDGDRLAIVDENGAYIGEEYTLALAAYYVLSKKPGTVATNLSTSRMIDNVAQKTGSAVIRTPVGEANVAAAMLQHNCAIGGEGNGGVIDLRVGPIRDSILAIALVLQLLAETGKTVSQLVSEIGGYFMVKEKFAADKQIAQKIIDAAKKLFADAKLDTTDGCRFDFPDGWLHIRVSNTEPVMRVIVEAKDQPTVQKYLDAVMSIRKQLTPDKSI